MKRVLVTGLSGFIGRHALPELILRGFEVHAISSIERPDSVAVHWHQADLLGKTNDVRSVVERIQPTHVLHLAWHTTPCSFWSSPENEQWQAASTELFQHCADSGVQRIVGAGSCAEYAWNETPCDERLTPLEPTSLYGQTKHATHTSLIQTSDEAGISAAWGRVFFMYGPGAHSNRMPGVVISALMNGEFANCSHGEQLRDFIHIRDAANALVSVLDSEITGPVNIASGDPVRIKDMVLTVADHFDARDRIRFGAVASNPNEPHEICANVERLRNELNWSPKFDLTSGIKDTVNWWQDTAPPILEKQVA
jgi:nucleoside-diphosphate-sugar epimerase